MLSLVEIPLSRSTKVSRMNSRFHAKACWGFWRHTSISLTVCPVTGRMWFLTLSGFFTLAFVEMNCKSSFHRWGVFHKKGTFNAHNNHTWVIANPHAACTQTETFYGKYMGQHCGGSSHLAILVAWMPDRCILLDILGSSVSRIIAQCTHFYCNTSFSVVTAWWSSLPISAFLYITVRMQHLAIDGLAMVDQWVGLLNHQSSDTFISGYLSSPLSMTPLLSAFKHVLLRIALVTENQDTPGIFENIRNFMQWRCEACLHHMQGSHLFCFYVYASNKYLFFSCFVLFYF